MLKGFPVAYTVLPREYKGKQILLISRKSRYERSTPCVTLLKHQIQHGAYTTDATDRHKNSARGDQLKTLKHGDH